MTYSGPADVVFTHGESESLVHNLMISFEQTHTSTFYLCFLPDRPERQGCTQVRVTLPNGWVEYGCVTYIPSFGLVFHTRDEWGLPRSQPSREEP